MNSLSLIRINQIAPYEVLDGGFLSFRFKTDDNVLYDISFMEDMEIAGCQSYQFSIRRLTEDYSGHDAKVKDTVIAILAEFFYTNNDILLYICDDSDGRESVRSRLFLRWFKECESNARFEIKSADATIEGKGFFAAIILRKDHPHYMEIVSEFDIVASNLTNNPDK